MFKIVPRHLKTIPKPKPTKIIKYLNTYLRFGCVLDLQIIDLKNSEDVTEFWLQLWGNFDAGFILNIFVDQVHHLRVEIDEVEFVGELEDSPKERRNFRQVRFVGFQQLLSVIQVDDDVIGVRE